MERLEAIAGAGILIRLRRGGQRGFTLVELLVALLVTAAVASLVFASFGLVGRAQEKSQGVLDRAERMLLVSQWLTHKLESMRQLSRIDGANTTIFFSGNAAGALWIAPPPSGSAGGGLFVFRATPRRHDDGQTDLVVEMLPYGGPRTPLDWQQAHSDVLLRNAKTLQWYYQDGQSLQWTQQWDPAARRYPVRIRVELADQSGEWPALVVALAGAR